MAPAACSTGNDGQRRRLAHVVRVGLEGYAEDANRLPVDIAAESGHDAVRHRPLARLVDADAASTTRRGAPASCAGPQQRPRVLGEARAAIARSGMQELEADAPVESDAMRHILDIGADVLADIGDLIDVAELGRQERIGRILGQLGRLQVGDQDGVR